MSDNEYRSGSDDLEWFEDQESVYTVGFKGLDQIGQGSLGTRTEFVTSKALQTLFRRVQKEGNPDEEYKNGLRDTINNWSENHILGVDSSTYEGIIQLGIDHLRFKNPYALILGYYVVTKEDNAEVWSINTNIYNKVVREVLPKIEKGILKDIDVIRYARMVMEYKNVLRV